MKIFTFAQYYNYPMMNSSDWGWGYMMLFWAILIIVGVMVAVHLLKSNKSVGGHKVDPLDIAKERYAKGEITKEQFDQVKKDLASR